MNKKTAILLLSLTSITSIVGYSTWVGSFNYSYVNNNKTADRPVAYIVGSDVQYTSVEKALDVAKAGDIVCLIPPNGDNYSNSNTVSTTEKAEYIIERNCTIKPGVTLIVPTDSNSISNISDSNIDSFLNDMNNPGESRDRGSNSSYGEEATKNPNRYLRVTLKIKDNVTLTNNGTLIVSGYLGNGSNSYGLFGQTSHSYSKIVLGSGASIVQKDNSSSKLYCYGFIDEETENNGSFLDISSGLLEIPFAIRDYRGMMFSWAMPDEAIEQYHASPFNQFEMKNISSKIFIYYGAKIDFVANIYGEITVMGKIQKNFSLRKNLVGVDDNCFIQMSSPDSMIISKYNRFLDNYDIDFYNNFKLNSIDLTLSYSIVTINLDTINSYFPVSYKYNIELFSSNSNSALFDTQNQRIKFLPGSKLYIHDNVTLKTKALCVMTSFYDGNIGSNLVNNCNSIKEATKYPLKEGAICILDDNAFIEAGEISGYFYCNDNSNITYNTNTSLIYEPRNYKNSGSTTPPTLISSYLIIKEKLNIINQAYFDLRKIFIGVNMFYDSINYLPSANIILNNNSFESVSEFQEIIFLDENGDYTNGINIEPTNNISIIRAFNNSKYELGTKIFLNNENNIIGIINSNLDINSDKDGINEFYAQSVTVRKKNEEGKLYVDTSLELEAVVDDIDKIYDKTITWTSDNPETISVDQDGVVTALKNGSARITATCNGISGFLDIETTVDSEIVELTGIYLTSDKGHTTQGTSDNSFETEEYSLNTEVKVSLHFLPEDAEVTDITWKFSNNIVNTPKCFYYWLNGEKIEAPEGDFTLQNINVREVSVKLDTKAQGNPDQVTITCTVSGHIYIDGKIESKSYVAKAFINQESDLVCLLPDSNITLFDGTTKLAKNLTKDDLILSYNHFKGAFEKSKILFDGKLPKEKYKIITLIFDNGNVLKIATGHGLFNISKMKYEIYYGSQFYNCIGDEFACVVNNNGNFNISKTKLIDVKITYESVIKITPISEYNINCIADGMLTVPDDIEGMLYGFKFKLSDTKLLIDVEDFNKQISKYGLYEYSDVENVVERYVYDTVGFKYFKTFIGMGVMSYDDANHLLDQYMKMILDYHGIEWDWSKKEQLSKKHG